MTERQEIPGIKHSEARKRTEGEAARLPNPNDEKKPTELSIDSSTKIIIRGIKLNRRLI